MGLDRLTRLDPVQLGRFRILARLGGGGMGNVYLAEADDGMPAAVKVIRAELAQDTQFRARFRREVEAGRRVTNRGIARFLDADTFAASPWLATEFVPGPTLHHQVFAKGPLVANRLLALGVGLADALVAIHAAGLVHRDLKPANVLLAPDAPKVIDFGISLAADATVLTTTGTLVGSPAYMSPEQAKGGKDVGPAADVFSWASCMTFASRRLPPFGEGEAVGVLYQVVHEQPDLTGVPDTLAGLVRAALEKDPANRPTAEEVVSALTLLHDGHSPATVVTTPADGGPARVVAPADAANAGRVLAASWEPDHVAVEEAERTMAEALELRASLPARAEERQRRERSRANRAVFAAMLTALVALLVVVFVTVRPGHTDLAKAVDNGQGPDAEVSTTGPGSAAAVVTASSLSMNPVSSVATTVTAATAATTVSPGATATRPTSYTAPTTVANNPPVSGPITTLVPFTCTAAVLNPAPAGPANRLPTAAADNTPTYSMRVTLTAGFAAGSLALVRQKPTPTDSWVKPIGSGSASTMTVGSFAMKVGGGPSTYQAGLVIHEEKSGTTFELQLRTADRSVSCGSFLGPP